MKLGKKAAAGILSVAAVVGGLFGSAPAATAYDAGSVKIWTHIQDYGWTELSGSVSLSLRLEAIRVYQVMDRPFCGRAHVAMIGWQAWQCTSSSNRQITLGTTGQSLAIEAVQVYTPGYNFRIDGHVQNIGDVSTQSPCAGCTAMIGTTGQGLRLEKFAFQPYNW